MKSLNIVFASLLLAAALAGPGMAASFRAIPFGAAQQNQVLSSGGGVLAPTAGTADLTSAECKGLGGKVSAPGWPCLQHGGCTTVDANGVVRKACLTAQ